MKRVKVDLSTGLKQKQNECEILLKERPELLDEIDKFRDESDNFQIALNKKVVELEECKKELTAAKAREQQYSTELSVVRQSYLIEKDELYSTRAKLVELYEHYQLLETQLETKTALYHLAESTENELKAKLTEAQRVLSTRSEEFEKWSSQKDKTGNLLDEANSQIEKLLSENERLKAQEIHMKGQGAFVIYMISDLEELLGFYEAESNKLGKQNTGFPSVTGPNDVKYKALSHQISTVFTEALLIMKYFEELKTKYNVLTAEIQNSQSKQSSTADADEIARLSLVQKAQEGQIAEMLEENKKLREEIEGSRSETERARVELDTARLRGIAMEKELRLKDAMIAQFENKFSGDPDELLGRIENLKNELENFNTNKGESRNLKTREIELRQVVERISHAISSIEPNLSCTSCFAVLNQAVMCLPCTHIVCSNCKPTENCKQCDEQVSKTIKLPIIDEISSKITYNKQAIEDMKLILAL